MEMQIELALRWEMAANSSDVSPSLNLHDIYSNDCALVQKWQKVASGIHLSNDTFCQVVLQSCHAVTLACEWNIEDVAV